MSNRYLGWAFMEAANLIRRYDERAKRWHARKLAKSNKVIAIKALACKLAKAGFCSMLSEAYDQMHARAANGASGHRSEHETEEDA
jgi:hypothetical protein